MVVLAEIQLALVVHWCKGAADGMGSEPPPSDLQASPVKALEDTTRRQRAIQTYPSSLGWLKGNLMENQGLNVRYSFSR